MFDFLMNDEQKALQEETRDFTRSVDRQYILDLDAEKIQYPKEILQEAGRRNLLGLRFPEKYGGRGLGWTDEIIALEEVATLGIPPPASTPWCPSSVSVSTSTAPRSRGRSI